MTRARDLSSILAADGSLNISTSVNLADNEKAYFGTSNDLQIYHNGTSASYITDQGTGNLVLGGDIAIILQNSAHDANMLDAYNGGRVGLYHANSLKLATTATGVDVTGAISSNKGSAGTLATFTDGVNSNFVIETTSLVTTVGNTGGSTALAFKSSNTERMRITSTGELLVGTTSDTMPAAAAAGQGIMAGTRAFISTEASGDTILGGTTGSNFTAIYQGGSEVVRVQTGGLTFTPATNNLYTVSGALSYYGTTNNVYLNGASSGGMIMSGNGNRYQYVYLNSVSDSVMITTNTVERLGIDSSGRVTMPYQPSFAAVLTTSPTATSGAIIPVNSAPVNIGNHFNTSTYTFTAPVSGRYFLSYFVRWNGYQASIYLHPRFYKNGGSFDYTHQIASIGTSTGAAYTSLTWSGVVQLAANDAITLHDASQGGVTLGTYQGNQTGFTGYLIG